MTHTKGREGCVGVSVLELECGGCYLSWKVVLLVVPCQLMMAPKEKSCRERKPPRAQEGLMSQKWCSCPSFFGGGSRSLWSPWSVLTNGLEGQRKEFWKRQNRKKGRQEIFLDQNSSKFLAPPPLKVLIIPRLVALAKAKSVLCPIDHPVLFPQESMTSSLMKFTDNPGSRDFLHCFSLLMSSRPAWLILSH